MSGSVPFDSRSRWLMIIPYTMPSSLAGLDGA